jgi:hypothetical protein
MVHHLFYFAIPTVESRWMKLCGGDSASERRRRARLWSIGSARTSTMLVTDKTGVHSGTHRKRDAMPPARPPICH